MSSLSPCRLSVVFSKLFPRMAAPAQCTSDISGLHLHWHPIWIPRLAFSPQWAINKHCWLTASEHLAHQPMGFAASLQSHLGRLLFWKFNKYFLIQWVSEWSSWWLWIHFQNSQFQSSKLAGGAQVSLSEMNACVSWLTLLGGDLSTPCTKGIRYI